MPLPNFVDWCKGSISSIYRSVNNIVNPYSKAELELSANVVQIQSLSGKTPGEKYKHLNSIVRAIVENSGGKEDLLWENEYEEIAPAMMSLIKILVGLKLHVNAVVVQGLMSEDTSINRRALAANWFFNGINEHVNAKNFVQNIMPFVSVYTRACIVRKLSYSLMGFEGKAEAFFNAFVELYGIELSLSLLTACSQSFIYDKIFEHKIKFPVKEIRRLFKKYPELVIQYLELGGSSDNNRANQENRRVLQVEIQEYDSFIPELLKTHPDTFIALYNTAPNKALKLSNKLSTRLVKNSKHQLIRNPQVLLKLVPLKILKHHVDETSFAIMISNLFPKDESDFNLADMLRHCKYHGDENAIGLLKNTYRTKYNKNLLGNKLCLESLDFLKMLANEEKHKLVKEFLEKRDHAGNEFLSVYKYYLPPNEVLPALKNEIRSTANAEERAEMIGHMIISCSLYKSKEGLSDVLSYYNDNHRNERNSVLVRFFQYLKQEFDLRSLESRHWSILNEIILYAHVKKELLNSHASLLESLLDACLYNILAHERDNTALLDKIFNIVVELRVEQFCTFNVLMGTGYEREFMEKCFSTIPAKYPKGHAIWETRHDRLTLALNLAKSIDSYNKRNCRASKKPKATTSATHVIVEGEGKLKIEHYPWIVKLAKRLFGASEREASVKRSMLLKIIKSNAPDLHDEIVEKAANIQSVEAGEALSLLKKDYRAILGKWSEYLNEARHKLHLGNKAARRFIIATKWYQDIPVRFIEKCLVELSVDGSFSVLALLLESTAFEKLVVPYIPVSGHIDLTANDAKVNYEITKSIVKAMRHARPPLPLRTVASFCKGDYALLAEDTFRVIGQCQPAHEVLDFAKQSTANCSTLMRKQCFRLIERVATRRELRDFLDERLKQEESDRSTSLLIVRMIFNLFARSPSTDSWQLVEACMNAPGIDRQKMQILADFGKIDANYLAAYVSAYLDKIDGHFNRNKAEVDFATRIKCILLLIDNLNMRIMNALPEALCERIVRQYFFDPDSSQVSQAMQSFTVRLYLLHAGENLEHRLRVIMQILKGIISNFNRPHPKKPRFYAANYTIQQFFEDALIAISGSSSSSDNKLEIVESMLRVLDKSLPLWQEPMAYLSLNLYREYLLASSPRNFGDRCAKRIDAIMAEFNASDSIVGEIVHCLRDLVANKIFREVQYARLIMSVIEGLLLGDYHYANLVAVKLLDHNEVSIYDERYDAIITSLRRKDSNVIQYHLHRHTNRIPAHYAEM